MEDSKRVKLCDCDPRFSYRSYIIDVKDARFVCTGCGKEIRIDRVYEHKWLTGDKNEKNDN